MEPPDQANGELFATKEVRGVFFLEILESFVRRFPRFRRELRQVDGLFVPHNRFDDDGGIDEIPGEANAVAAAARCGATCPFLVGRG